MVVNLGIVKEGIAIGLLSQNVKEADEKEPAKNYNHIEYKSSTQLTCNHATIVVTMRKTKDLKQKMNMLEPRKVQSAILYAKYFEKDYIVKFYSHLEFVHSSTFSFDCRCFAY